MTDAMIAPLPNSRRTMTMASRTRRTLLAGASTLAAISFAMATSADAANWTGVLGPDWFTAGNWSNSSVPGAADSSTINTGSAVVNAAGAVSADVTVGSNAVGALTISNGGTLLTSTVSMVGASAGSNGTMTVTGANSAFLMSAADFTYLFIGNGGSGTLNVTDGGTVARNFTTGGFANRLFVGQNAGSVGVVNVSGTGSHIDFTETQVGVRGTGTINVSNGASARFGGTILGDGLGSSGTLNVDGGSATADGGVTVGAEGVGRVSVTNGGSLSLIGIMNVGLTATARSTATIDGAGSSLTATMVRVGSTGSGSLTVANGATFTATDTVSIATYIGSAGTLNVGAAAGETAVGSGAIIAPAISFGEGNGTLVFNHTDSNLDIASDIKTTSVLVPATINHLSGTTIFSGNSAAFGGVTNVTGGTVFVTGTLGGVTNVNSGASLTSGGTLGGTGTVSSANIGARGTLAPGLPGAIGTLNVAGNLSLASGSTYAVEVAGDGTSDLVSVGGTTTIGGGTMRVSALDAQTSYLDGRRYTVLTSSGGLSGSFTTTASNSAFLNVASSYDANNAYVTIGVRTDGGGITPEAPPEVFVTVAQTANQIATAEALDGLEQSGSALALYNSLLVLSGDEALTAFDQLGGEIHASAQTALIGDSHFIRDAMNDRLRSATGNLTPTSPSVFAFFDDEEPVTAEAEASAFPVKAQKAPTTNAERFSIWGNGFGAWGKVSGDGNASKLDRNVGGFLMGGDTLVFDSWRVGAMGGYSRSTFDTLWSSGESDNYHAGLYAGTQWDALAFRSGAAYTWHRMSTSRTVAYTGLSESLAADYNASTFQAFGELGYRFDTIEGPIEPFVNLSHVRLSTDGFSESGGISALSGTSETMSTTFGTLGIRATGAFEAGNNLVAVRAMIGWQHAFGDTDPTSVLRFAGSDAFTIAGVGIDEDTAVAELGLDMNLSPAAAIGISWTGQVGIEQTGSKATENGFNARFNVKF